MIHKLVFFFLAISIVALCAEPADRIFELRTYHAHEGKIEDLQTRFRDHTVALFTKHGMTNVGYWVPVKNDANLLIYLLSYPTTEARETSWKAFMADPDWKAVSQASTVDGKLVRKIDSVFLKETDFSSSFGTSEDRPRLFEMRTYHTADGMLPHLHKRFREHTQTIFEKHGMTNLGYFELLANQENAGRTLIYFLAHKDADDAKKSWDAFRNDPEWKKVAADSEKSAGGPILQQPGQSDASAADLNGDGVITDAEFKQFTKSATTDESRKAVESVYLQPTDFSPTK